MAAALVAIPGPWAPPRIRWAVGGVGRLDRTDALSRDLRLMEAIKAGEADALAALYARYGRAVTSLCRRIVGDARDAEEATLDAFVQLWEHGDRYDPGRASPLSYLMTLARSRALDRARALGRQRSAVSDDDGALLAALARSDGAAASPLTVLLTAEHRGGIESALAGLPAEQREALALAFLEGLSHREVAERLGAPLGTVKTRIRQGLLRLRDALARLPGDWAP